MSVILGDKNLTNSKSFWMDVSSLHAMATDPECNHRLSEYAWYSLWASIFTDLAAGMRARAPSQLHIFAPAPQFCLWARAAPRPVASQPVHDNSSGSHAFPSPPVETPSAESISAVISHSHDGSTTSTQHSSEATPRNFRLPDISLLGFTSKFNRRRERDSLHERKITKFTIPVILEVKPDLGSQFAADVSEAQSDIIDQAKYLFAAYEQNVVIGIAAAGLAFRYAIFHRKEGTASTASQLLDPDYTNAPENLDTSQDWCKTLVFGKANILKAFESIVRIAFEEVLNLPYDKKFTGPPPPHTGDSDSEYVPLATRTRSKAQPKDKGGKASVTGEIKSKGKGKARIESNEVPEAGPSKPRK